MSSSKTNLVNIHIILSCIYQQIEIGCKQIRNSTLMRSKCQIHKAHRNLT